MGGVGSRAGALPAQDTSNVPSDFDSLEVYSSCSKWGLERSLSILTGGAGQQA